MPGLPEKLAPTVPGLPAPGILINQDSKAAHYQRTSKSNLLVRFTTGNLSTTKTQNRRL